LWYKINVRFLPPAESVCSNNDVVHVDKIPYIDHPEIRVNKNESIEMPFRYVADEKGNMIMPEVRTTYEICVSKAKSDLSREWLT
jgi:hypothetical protein